jgi:hypothetical protein
VQNYQVTTTAKTLILKTLRPLPLNGLEAIGSHKLSDCSDSLPRADQTSAPSRKWEKITHHKIGAYCF